jgi:hypothetical protein
MPFYTTIGPRAFHYSHRWGRHSRCYCPRCSQRRSVATPPAPVAAAVVVMSFMIFLVMLTLLVVL